MISTPHPHAGKPMNAKQATLLRHLCEVNGEPFWPGASHRHAWAMIANLKGTLNPSREKIIGGATCPTCNELPGSPCREPDGAPRTATHKARAVALRAAEMAS